VSVVDREISAPAGAAGLARATPLTLMERGLAAVVVLVFALALLRAFIANVNWDEFYYLSQVHAYRNGTLAFPLQTFYVHFFAWLPLIAENELEQILAARVALWLLSVPAAILLYKIARSFCSRQAALLTVLFYFGFSNVVDHGLSFRADPLCAFFILASLYCLLRAEGSRFNVPLSAVFMGIAMMISIKSVFYLGTIGTIFLALWLFEPDRRATLRKTAVFALAFAGTALVLYHLHDAALASAATTELGAFVQAVGNKTLVATELFPRLNTLLRTLVENGPIWVFVILGLAAAGRRLAKGPERKTALVLVAFAVPLLSLPFYRNAFVYFYVFLMPAAVVLGGTYADSLLARLRRSRSPVLLLAIGGTVMMIAGSAVGDYLKRLPDQTSSQRETIDLAHRLFPEPVPYIDRNSMIASFPKVGFFMSSWGMENYWARGRPVMEDLIRARQPKFLIANSCALDMSRPSGDETPRACYLRLMDEDLAALRGNFVHHWGALYLAGKAFERLVPGQPEGFEILIAGAYTLEAAAAVVIDGTFHRPGDLVHLDLGRHRIAALDRATGAVLRFGDNPDRPARPPSDQPIYYGF